MTRWRPLARLVRGHWLIAVCLGAGLALRVAATVAYRPALLYVDTIKYLYNAYPGADPVGYKAPLTLILAIGNLELVAVVQHLVGIAIAVTIYVTLARLGAQRWLAALAAAPILLDAYQIQIEQMIMPDLWFEALIVAGLAFLVPRRLGFVLAGGFMLGLSATVRQVGEILIIPALVYLVAAGGGWRTIFHRSIALTVAFAVPILGYMTGSQLISGHFWLASGSISISTYGRMASAADCATLRIPAYERPLCPNARQRSLGIDWLDHSARSPIKTYDPPAGMSKYAIVASFDHQVAEQQPERVAAAVVGDAVKLFAITRTSSQEGTPISRWQFQDFYPAYPAWVTVTKSGEIVFGLRLTAAGGPLVRHPLEAGYGGRAFVDKPVAAFLRSYQLGGGYTPGPALALLALAALLGSALVLMPKLGDGTRRLAVSCLLFFGSGVAVLAISDTFEFSWRYQLPALVTLPPAGVLGIAALAGWLTARRTRTADAPASAPADGPAEMVAPAK